MPFFRGTISKKIVFLASFFKPLIKGFLAAGGKSGGGFWLTAVDKKLLNLHNYFILAFNLKRR